MKTNVREFVNILRYCLLFHLALAALLVLNGCSSGTESPLPTITFVDNHASKGGVPVYSGSLHLHTDARQGFIELLTDKAYEEEKDKGFFGPRTWARDTYQITNQDMSIPLGKYGEQRLWVRAAVPDGETVIKGSSLDRILYSLIGAPIDETKNKKVVRIEEESRGKVYYFYLLGEPQPFIIEKAEKRQSGVPSVTNRVTAGKFTFQVPPDWEVLSGNEERKAKQEIEASVQKLLESYSGAATDTSMLGIKEFKTVRIPDNAGWFIAYNIRIPPQQNYLLTMEKEQEQKLSWGKQQGIVSRVIEHGLTKIDGSEVVKVDSEMREGTRTIGIYHWSPTDPSDVGTIQVVVNPGLYDRIRPTINTVIASLQITKDTK